MRLAIGKDGRLGRQILGQGLTAKTAPVPKVDHVGNVYLSEGQIKASQNHFAKEEQKKRFLQGVIENNRRQTEENAIKKKRRQAAGVMGFQNIAKVDPLNEKLKRHFANQKRRPEYAKVADSLYHSPLGSAPGSNGGGGGGATSGSNPMPYPPADASGQGANMHLVPSGDPRDPVVWHSDYRRTMIKGNPLTRDGKFGPSVTDYDRFVRGTDVNDAQMGREPIVGNTIVGRYEGMGKMMGFDPFSLDSYTNLLDKTADNLVSDLPDQLAEEIKRALGQGGTSTTSPTGQITIQRPVISAGTTAGIPSWALYTGLGLLGLGALFVGVKAFKK